MGWGRRVLAAGPRAALAVALLGLLLLGLLATARFGPAPQAPPPPPGSVLSPPACVAQALGEAAAAAAHTLAHAPVLRVRHARGATFRLVLGGGGGREVEAVFKVRIGAGRSVGPSFPVVVVVAAAAAAVIFCRRLRSCRCMRLASGTRSWCITPVSCWGGPIWCRRRLCGLFRSTPCLQHFRSRACCAGRSAAAAAAHGFFCDPCSSSGHAPVVRPLLQLLKRVALTGMQGPPLVVGIVRAMVPDLVDLSRPLAAGDVHTPASAPQLVEAVKRALDEDGSSLARGLAQWRDALVLDYLAHHQDRQHNVFVAVRWLSSRGACPQAS
jgi:hypothetical protein